VSAFAPRGESDGDNPQLAKFAIKGNPATAWYTTASLVNLGPGTGLLLDMSRLVTITGAQITLGSIPGADFQLRPVAAPALADLPPIARTTDAGGVVRLRVAPPVRGRYVLIWFTRLPADPSGTFQAIISNITLDGLA